MEAEMTGEPALFRPNKRRKFQRARPRTEDEDNRTEVASSAAETQERNGQGAEAPAIAEILKSRKAQRNRRHGVEFSNARTNKPSENSVSTSLTTIDPQVDKLRAISDRFVGHTGQVVDVDKHMFVLPFQNSGPFHYYVTLTNKLRVAYIESEMAKRRLGQSLPPSTTAKSTQDQSSESETGIESEDSDDGPPIDKRMAQRHPASLGKIHEIDLGTDATLRNAERTQTALRRAQVGEVLPAEDEQPRKSRKPRIGRDGKPMKPRPRKRRNSEDIKRDQLVEQVLRESRLEIYDEPESAQQGNDGLDTDEKIAEQFRQDFMDAMESRQRNRTAGQPKMPVGKQGDVSQKGPKLGGSRSARAAMREKELAEQKMKK